MVHKTLGCMAILFLVLAFPASASMVSFLLVETGINNENMNTQHGSLWEGGLMEVFFNAGHIVTNYPITRMDKKPTQDLSGVIRADFIEAAENGAEYFILGFLEYKEMVPVGVTLKLYKTKTQELVFEQNFPAGRGRSMNEEYSLAQNAGRIIVSNIKDS